MVDKKNHPSLPSNYVTLAHLQERWLKQQQMQQNENQQQQQQQKLQRQDTQKRHGTFSRSAFRKAGNNRAKQYRPTNRNDSGSNRPAIEAVGENRRESEASVGIGDGNADLKSKDNESKAKKKKKKKKNNNNNKEKRKTSVEKEERGAREDAAAQAKMEEKKEAEKTAIKSELNEKNEKSGNSVVDVEQRVRTLSMNSGNGRLRRVREGFHRSESQRNYYGYGYGDARFGGGSRRQHYEEPKRSSGKKVWVRKDGNVGEIQT